MSDLTSMIAALRPERTSFDIALELDLEPPIVPVSIPDLMELAQQLGLDRETKRNFVCAGLVFTAQGENGQPLCCAVEISRTIQQCDIDLARRNAGLLRQALRHPTYAVVCGYSYEFNLYWGEVRWAKMIDRS